MAQTLERSLKSILSQIGDRFEVLVVDDASTDESRSVLDAMVEEHTKLRTQYLEPDPNRRLGETRNISVRESRGEYVLLHLDTDDIYQQGIITDFVYVFHKLEAVVGEKKVIQIPGMRMASKEFLLEIGPYRNLPVGGEDMDFWRRLLADDALIYIDAAKPHQSIGYEKTNKALMKRWYRVAVSDFQSKISPISYFRWTVTNHGPKRIVYYLLTLPIAYTRAALEQSYPAPKIFRTKGELPKQLFEIKITLSELEAKYGIEIERTQLSENGRNIFFPETSK